MRFFLFQAAILSTLLFLGCDSTGNQEPSERTYSVTYSAVTDHDTCTVTMINKSNGISQFRQDFGGQEWQESFDVTVKEFDSFYASLAVSCFNFDSPVRTLSGQIVVDDEVVREAEEEGQTVSFDLDASLTLEGIKDPFSN